MASTQCGEGASLREDARGQGDSVSALSLRGPAPGGPAALEGPLKGRGASHLSGGRPSHPRTGSTEERATQGHLASPAALGLDFDKGPFQRPFVSVGTFGFKRQKCVSSKKSNGSCNSKVEAISGRAASWPSAEQGFDLSTRLWFPAGRRGTSAPGLTSYQCNSPPGSIYFSVVPAQAPELVSIDPAGGAILERVFMIRMY